MQKIAIIIGAGPAGLTAAYKLLKETDIKPIIYEESNVIGGISQTFEYKGNRMDIGGHRFFTKNDLVMDVWKELMKPQGAPALDEKLLNENKQYEGKADPEKEDDVFLTRRRVSRIYYLGKFFDYPISMKPRTFLNMGFFRTMSAGFGYIHSCIFKKKEDSLENFYINRFGKPLYNMFFKDYTTKVWGRSPKEISPDWGAQRVKGLSLMKTFVSALTKPFRKKSSKVETSLIEEFYYPKKGPGQLYSKMADEITKMGGEIHFDSKVNNVHLNGNSIDYIEVNGNIIKGDYYISSMPIKDLMNSMNDVDKSLLDIANNLPYRDFITVGLLLDKLKIKNKTKMKTVNNIVPDCWIYIQDNSVKLGRLQIFNNWSPYMVDDLEKHIFVGLEYFCNEGDEMWNMKEEDFIKFAIDELVKIKIIDKEDVLDSVELKIKKAYPAYFDSYVEFPKVKDYLNSIDNLYCIGRNGQHRYNNMDHSMLTAIETVNVIKNGLDKSIIWNVNADKEYHETKEAN
ncbi:MAG: NAD(P)/FAD-dependent oxidoreductase [Candidatus Enteromonas sp.]|nr:NAD(P)/FAD-dependent oxidoreductase [Mollicutes bacterium]MDY3904475.1 NAD(P)/FAD-dependent oxidoreductase [Candidatus Enteromonas sp.]